jgi:hypothetical protein
VSRKPPKKSDRGRPWRSGERRSARYVRVQMTRHLIVCEGTRTEPGYFNGLKAALGETNGRKVDVRGGGTGMHTVDLLEHAQELCRTSPNAYDHVWLAYDKDYFPAEEFDLVERGCANAGGSATFHAIWSNPCFEEWLLLHFGYSTAEDDPAGCLARLDHGWRRAFGRPYDKADEGLFAKLRSRLGDAKRNAAKLDAHHERMGNRRPSEKCPGTAVHTLFGELGPYLE